MGLTREERIRRILQNQDVATNQFVGAFEKALQDVISRSQARVQVLLQRNLAMEGGKVARTAANQRVLRKLDELFEKEMKRRGYDTLVTAYVESFNEQFAFFEEVIDALGLDPVKFSARDRDDFLAQQMGAEDSLQSVVKTAAQNAKRRALFQVGGMKMTDLAETVAGEFGKTMPMAQQIADTSMTMFYRSVTDRGFKQIAKEGTELRYRFEGPSDKLTRPFCRRLLAQTLKKPLKREEIDRLDNRQIPNVFISGGGYNCRHQWVVEVVS